MSTKRQQGPWSMTIKLAVAKSGTSQTMSAADRIRRIHLAMEIVPDGEEAYLLDNICRAH